MYIQDIDIQYMKFFKHMLIDVNIRRKKKI